MILKKKQQKFLPFINLKPFQTKRTEDFILCNKKEQKSVKFNSIPKINTINLNCKKKFIKINSILNESSNSIISNDIKAVNISIETKYKNSLNNKVVFNFNKNNSQKSLFSSFLNRSSINLKKNIYSKKNLKEIKQNEENQKINDKKNFKLHDKVFVISKDIIFERKILNISVYDDFRNYKEGKIIENCPKKFVLNLEKTLIGKDKSTNDDIFVNDHDEEQKDTIETIFLNNKITFLKNKLKSMSCDNRNNFLDNQDSISPHFLKKIILKKRQKFNGCEQKNKQYINLISKRRKLANDINSKNNNNIDDEKNSNYFDRLKQLNEYNNILFRKKRIKKIFDEANNIKDGFRTLDEEFDLCAKNAKDEFEEENNVKFN